MTDRQCNLNGTLAGKVAIVTGASRGIGEAIAYRLAMEGAQVVASARTADTGEHPLPGTINDTVEQIRRCGGEAMAVRCNLVSAEERESLIQQTETAYGPVDIVVSNAAVSYFVPVVEFQLKHCNLMFEVQVKAPFHLAQRVLPTMLQRQSGHIINISSGAAIHPKADAGSEIGDTVYGMCKAALERFTTGLAHEMYAHGVCVNAISPGLVATPGATHHHLIPPENRDQVQAVEVVAEGVYQLAVADISMSGRIDHAEPLLAELNVAPSPLLRDFPLYGDDTKA